MVARAGSPISAALRYHGGSGPSLGIAPRPCRGAAYRSSSESNPAARWRRISFHEAISWVCLFHKCRMALPSFSVPPIFVQNQRLHKNGVQFTEFMCKAVAVIPKCYIIQEVGFQQI